jgi:hypothetical protein
MVFRNYTTCIGLLIINRIKTGETYVEVIFEGQIIYCYEGGLKRKPGRIRVNLKSVILKSLKAL